MKTIVYLTINTVNHKIYVGVHTTENPDVFDGYLGCGCNRNAPSSYKRSKTPFQYAINKYGVDAFRRYTLAIFDNEEDAFELESKIVTEEFIRLPYVYNATTGGHKGQDQSVTVYQYTLSGEFVDSFPSYRKAAECLNCSSSSIKAAAKYKTTSHKYLWTNEYKEKLDINQFNVFDPESIFEYDENGNFITSYESVTKIIEKYSVNRSTVNRAIQGKYNLNGKYYSREFVDKFDKFTNTSIKNKPIYLYNLDGTFFKEYSSPIECVKSFGLKSSSSISSAIRLGRAFKGYQVYLEKVESAKKLQLNNQKKLVDQYDMQGNYIKTWDSITAAVKEYGQGVCRCIKGQSKHCKNFIFKLRS